MHVTQCIVFINTPVLEFIHRSLFSNSQAQVIYVASLIIIWWDPALEAARIFPDCSKKYSVPPKLMTNYAHWGYAT